MGDKRSEASDDASMGAGFETSPDDLSTFVSSGAGMYVRTTRLIVIVGAEGSLTSIIY